MGGPLSKMEIILLQQKFLLRFFIKAFNPDGCIEEILFNAHEPY